MIAIIEKSKALLYKYFPFLDRYRSFRQFVKFCVIGMTNVCIDFLVYIILTRFFHLYFVLANLGSFAIAVSWSFYMNKNWTFKDFLGEKLREKYIKFFVTNAIGVSIQTLLLYCFVVYMHWNDIISKALAVVIVVFWNFFVSKYWVFRI